MKVNGFFWCVSPQLYFVASIASGLFDCLAGLPHLCFNAHGLLKKYLPAYKFGVGEFMFRNVRSQDVDLDGITVTGNVTVAACCRGTIVWPAPGEGYKISGEYAFVNDAGDVFVLHDWLSTSLYGLGGPTPEEFWATTEPKPLSVSSLDLDIGEFRIWLEQILAMPMGER